jgi:hypothetical protein
MNRLPCCLVIDREMLAEICKHLHIYNCLSDVCFCACSLPLPLFSLCIELLIQIQIMKFLMLACKADMHFGKSLGKMDRFSWSCCFIETGQWRGESNYKDLSLKVVGVTLTGFLFWESCRVAIFLLIPIGIIPGNGVYGLNVCSADGTLSIGSRTSSVLMASEQSGSGVVKVAPSLRLSQGSMSM